MSEVIRAAAKKWFYESFDCDLLEKMEKAGLIAQAEGFSISVMADLELDMEAAFDRVTAERDAALAENKLLRHDVCSYLETVAKVCDMLGVDLESAKSAEGKPSDVLFGYISAMQQRLTAADERGDVLEGLLRVSIIAMKRIYQAGYNRIIAAGGTCDTPEYMMESDPTVRDIRAALKPAEGGGDEI